MKLIKNNLRLPILRKNRKDGEDILIYKSVEDIICSDPLASDYEPVTLYGNRVNDLLTLFLGDISSVTLSNSSTTCLVKSLLNTVVSMADAVFIVQANTKHNGIDINLANILSLTVTAIKEFDNEIMLPKELHNEWLPLLSNEPKLKPVKIYNMESQELHSEAKIFGGNPDGIVNFEDTPHQFAVASFKAGQERNWVAEQINVNEDVKIYPTLSPERKRQLLLGTAQPTTNDSIQTAQIARLIQYISSPVVVCALSRQQYEEALHSQSYSRLIRDVVGENYIFYMHREYIDGKKNEHFSPELYEKNDAVRRMYARLYQTENPTLEDLLIVLVANQILEEMVFPGAFAFNFAFDERLQGFISMYSEISKDKCNFIYNNIA